MYEMHKNITFNTNKLTYTIKYIIISRVNDYTKRDVNQGKNIRIWRIVAGCGTKTESSAAAETETAAVKSEASDTEQAQESQEPSASGDPIRIGLTTVLTGDRSLEGEYASNAAKIITEEINTQGGVLGRPIEIVIEDALGTDVG